MKLQRLLLAGGLVVSALIAIFGDRDRFGEAVSAPRAESPSKLATREEAQASMTKSHRTTHVDVTRILSRANLADGDQDPVEPDKTLFAVHSWAPPPPAPAAPEKPTAPPLPFSYLGKEFDGRQWRVFLARQSAVLIVKADDVIEDTYRIEKISPPVMTVLYMPLNESQQLSIQ